MSLNLLFSKLKGGAGSGNFGHKHLPGKHSQQSHAGGRGYLSDRKTVPIKVGGIEFSVDEVMSDLIPIMNSKGLETSHSCSGHVCDKPLESEISYRYNAVKGGDKAHDKLQAIVNSGKLKHDWILEQHPVDNRRYSLYVKGGFYGLGKTISTDINVRNAVRDFDMITDVLK